MTRTNRTVVLIAIIGLLSTLGDQSVSCDDSLGSCDSGDNEQDHGCNGGDGGLVHPDHHDDGSDNPTAHRTGGKMTEETATTGGGDTAVQIDPNGYVIFCLCMGNLGNKMDQFLGALAFAKKLNRTFVLPTLAHVKSPAPLFVPFSEWFKLEPLMSYHRGIQSEDFMQNIAPHVWPRGKRIGFCRAVARNCVMKSAGYFDLYWDNLDVDFDDTVLYKPSHNGPRKAWDRDFPVSQYPVLAFKGAPADYPLLSEYRHLQSLLVFSDSLHEETLAYMDSYFPQLRKEKFVAIHLRNGGDWVHACAQGVGKVDYMSASQCTTTKPITSEMCFPSMEELTRLTADAIHATGAKYVYLGTDYKPMHKELENALREFDHEVRVFWRRPPLPIIDLNIMSMSDHFIGNCVSSFTAFVKRARDVAGKPTSFWGQPLRT